MSATREIYLQPGQWWFGSEHRLRTVLGSCIALTLWHPAQRTGGMCHFMLPRRATPVAPGEYDGRYADEALALLLAEIAARRHNPYHYQVQMFGGGRMFGDSSELADAGAVAVPRQNIEAARQLLKQHRLHLTAEHVGELGHRQIVFDLRSGQVEVQHTPLPPASPGKR